MKTVAINCDSTVLETIKKITRDIPGCSLDAHAIDADASVIGAADALFCYWADDSGAGAEQVSRLDKLRSSPGVPIILISPNNGASSIQIPGLTSFFQVQAPIDPQQLIHIIQNNKAPPAKGSPEFMVKQFIHAANETLTTMCDIQKVSKVKIFLETDRKPFGEFSGIIGLSGAAKGSMVLSFPGPVMKKLAGNMLETAPEELSDEDARDALGEIVNMIAGGAKKLLADTKFSFCISLPTVVSGKDHAITWQNNKPYIGVKLAADGDEFVMYLSVEPQKRAEQ